MRKPGRTNCVLGEIAIAIGAIAIAIGAISFGEIAIASEIAIAIAIAIASEIAIARSGDRRFARDRRDRDRDLADFDDRDRADLAIDADRRDRDRDRRRSAQFRSGEIAIVVRRCGWSVRELIRARAEQKVRGVSLCVCVCVGRACESLCVFPEIN